MDRYAVMLVLLALAVAPLFYFNVWAGAAVLVLTYAVATKVANKALDRRHRTKLDLPRRPRKR